ncbi:hemerythrin domain-containing protein [Autumnicola psychrophila]|uniref:Hemerythrin domain-containing protein n=1 Tax=Autumnicola psychrophila TaxID=3075592 RepID=A0ABU3DTZ1_9FLAO|nr:hemerythrin domain-containing protein [Zunongwangia sp. F225]MDT0687183.1 hemerythrin domain-containing protein [Zunongwangia sp. F225]
MKKPLKRHKALIPLSRQHHYGLLLSWKLREGFKKNIDLERMKNYTDWFWQYHLIPHFDTEEQHIFPILGRENDLVRKAITEHRRLKDLFNEAVEVKSALQAIEEELQSHIRYEERVLFQEIQEIATPAQLAKIEEIHQESKTAEEWEDEFWLK